MEDLNLNVFNIIIIFGVVNGIICSLILLLNSRLQSKTNNYLALTIQSLCYSNLQYWFLDVGITKRIQYDQNTLIFIPFEFLILPFFYLFVKVYVNRSIKRKEIGLLFIPFVLSVIYILIRNTFNDALSVIKIFNLTVEYVSLIFNIVIIILVFRIIIKHERLQKQLGYKTVPLKINWLKRLLITGLLLCFIWFMCLNFFEALFKSGYYKFYPLWIGISIFIYWMAITAILQKRLYQERVQIRSLKSSTNKVQNDLLSKTVVNTNTNNEILSLIKDEKLYLNPNLDLNFLSKKLNFSVSYISKQISNSSVSSFKNYINGLRLQEAKIMLKDKHYSNYTIVAIAYECGFNSKSAFYNAFKKQYSITPSIYRKQ